MTELNYELTGPADAPVLVLVNSIGTTMAMWDEQLARLGDNFRILRYDHPGHGASPDPQPELTVAELARGLYRLIGELEIERFSMWGISMGGMVAMYIAAHHSDQIDGLVLAATALGFPSPDPWLQRAEKVRAEGLAAIAPAVMERYFSEPFRSGHPELVERFSADLLACSAEGYARCCEALASWDFEYAARIAVPTLVLIGADDAALPAALTEPVAQAIPGATMQRIANAGHLLNVEQPAEATVAAKRHLAAARSDA